MPRCGTRVDETVVSDADVDKGAKVGDVRDVSCEMVTNFEVIDGRHAFPEQRLFIVLRCRTQEKPTSKRLVLTS